jgi:hypothetical protein
VFFRHVARLIDAWRAITRFSRTAWRVLPGDLMGMLVIRASSIPGITRELVVGSVSAALVEHPNAGHYLDQGLMPIRAQTLRRYMIAREPLSAALVEHEFEHVRQWERFGPLFLPAYFASSVAAWMRRRPPYWANRFEVAARRRECPAPDTQANS